jgi:hypothetical protein
MVKYGPIPVDASLRRLSLGKLAAEDEWLGTVKDLLADEAV